MTMIEKIASGMFCADFPDSEWHPTEDGYMRMARAALEAMKEPTDGMLAATYKDEDGRIVWNAMIEAALAEK